MLARELSRRRVPCQGIQIEGDGRGEEGRGRKEGEGLESRRSSPNSELPLSQRGAEWLPN